jgi:glycosyltransferase involved in cell wall biosynthesis
MRGRPSGLFAPFRDRSLFVVWGPPSHGPRSKVFARELGIDVHFLYSTTGRGLRVALRKYSYQAVKTLQLLYRERPEIVFVQSPPSFAVLFVYVYCATTRARFVVDAHSGALQSSHWTRPRWLYRLLARSALATIVTNEHFAGVIRDQRGRALVLRDIPTVFPDDGSFRVDGDFTVVVVNTFAPDEPLRDVLTAAGHLEGVTFYVTGDTNREGAALPAIIPENVHFTDYLPDESYYSLLKASGAVMCLTTRDHTMQRGACEALSLGKPIITSRWPLLEDYFHKGTVHVDNTSDDIRSGVAEMVMHHDRFRREIVELQSDQQREWEIAMSSIISLLDAGVGEQGEA